MGIHQQVTNSGRNPITTFFNLWPVAPPFFLPYSFLDFFRKISSFYPERLFLGSAIRIARLCEKIYQNHISRLNKFQAYKTDYSICNLTAYCLWMLLLKVRPEVIVEFGTGYSTLVLSEYAKYSYDTQRREVFIISFESDIEWFSKQREIIKALGIGGQVELYHSPLDIKTDCKQISLIYQGVEQILHDYSPNTKADFTFVDGPRGIYGRYGSLNQAISLTKPGGLILLHDALRKNENQAITLLLKERSSEIECLGFFLVTNGLAIFGKK